jgi:hypothetical protein
MKACSPEMPQKTEGVSEQVEKQAQASPERSQVTEEQQVPGQVTSRRPGVLEPVREEPAVMHGRQKAGVPGGVQAREVAARV